MIGCIKRLTMWIVQLARRLSNSWVGRPVRGGWQWTKSLPNSTAFWLALVGIVLVGSILGLVFGGWDWFRPPPSEGQSTVPMESRSTTIRNVGFVIGGVVALVFAIWRGVVAHRQAATAERQAETALHQSETAQQGLLNERYQKGAEMLGNEVLTVRLGGIYALRSLAEEHPEQYHVQVMSQLCAFVRHPTEVEGQPIVEQVEFSMTREQIMSMYPDITDVPSVVTTTRSKPREDIQAAMAAIAFCHDKNQKVETDNTYWLDLRGADLRGVDLSNMNLSRASLNFESVSSFYQLITTGMHTDMRETKLDGASLVMTNLSRVDLSGSTGLTQLNLDIAAHDSEDAPKLDNVIDPNTGEQLVWRRNPLDDDT